MCVTTPFTLTVIHVSINMKQTGSIPSTLPAHNLAERKDPPAEAAAERGNRDTTAAQPGGKEGTLTPGWMTQRWQRKRQGKQKSETFST